MLEVYPISVILAFLSLLTLILDIPPLIWHSRNRNFAAASLIFWIVLLNSFNFTNAIIWPSDDALSPNYYDGAGLCDIEVKLDIGSWAALPGALVSIMWSLANVMDTDRAIIPSKAAKQRQFALDIFFSWGFPVYLMLVHYIVQPSRYFLWGISGCNPSLDNGWVSVALIFIWPVVLSVVGAYSAILLIIRMRRYRKTLNSILSSHNTTRSRFYRLFAMALIMIIGLTPVQFYILFMNIDVMHHGFSWTEVHGPGWNQVVKIPSNGGVIFDRWIKVAAGILVFLFFGIGRDARDLYTAWLSKIGLGRFVVRRSAAVRQSRGSSWDGITGKVSNLFSKTKSTQTSDLGSQTAGTRTSTSSKSTFLDSPKKAIFDVLHSGLHHSKRPSTSTTSSGPVPLKLTKQAPATASCPEHSPATAEVLEKEKGGQAVVMKKEIWQESEDLNDEIKGI